MSVNYLFNYVIDDYIWHWTTFYNLRNKSESNFKKNNKKSLGWELRTPIKHFFAVLILRTTA